MSTFTKEQVDSYADKLLIGLTEEENKMVLEEFELIDRNINLINEIEGIKDIEPMNYALDDFSCSLREDIVEDSIDIDDLLSNCDSSINDEIKVPKVVE